MTDAPPELLPCLSEGELVELDRLYVDVVARYHHTLRQSWSTTFAPLIFALPALLAMARRPVPERGGEADTRQLLDDLIALEDSEAHIEDAYERMLPRIKAARTSLAP